MSAAGEPTLHDVFDARQRLLPRLSPTPLRHSEWLSDASGAHVWLKLESAHVTNSFKIRGALNALMRARANGTRTIVTASAGNHGRAVAYAASSLDLEVVVFTPASAPETKKAAIRRLGATLRDDGPDYDAAERMARAFATEINALYLSPYSHRDVIAGAGTIALELLDDAPDLDVVVVPLGGGGLASGVALALRAAAPQVRVVGVEVDASTPFAVGFRQGAITPITVQPSLADGLVGNLEPGSITFDLVRRHVDRLASVSEEGLWRAIRGLAAEEHLIAEGAGAAATAALLTAHVAEPGERVAVLLTGSNIDLARLAAILQPPPSRRDAS